MSHHGFSGLTSSHLDPRPLGLSEARDDGLRTPGDEADSEWRLDADRIKKGQALLISQAWQKHDRARRLISKGDIHAVMEVDWKKEMESYMNETFVTSLELTPKPHDGVFVSEVFTTVQRVIKQASAKGHSVGSALSLETGWDFRHWLIAKLDVWWWRRKSPTCWCWRFLVARGQHSCDSTLRMT